VETVFCSGIKRIEQVQAGLTEQWTIVSRSLIGLDLTGLEGMEDGRSSMVVEDFEGVWGGLSYFGFSARLGSTNGSLRE